MENMTTKCYPSHNIDNEITNFIKVWSSVFLSLSYCYFSLNITQKPLPRLLFYIPVITLFLILPLNLHSMHLGGTTAFFIAWLANFKLLLLAFNKGPLSDPSLSLSKFIALTCFPIRIQDKPGHGKVSGNGGKLVWNYGVKAVFVAVFFNLYGYNEKIHPKIIMIIYCFHIYFMLELMLAMVAAVARAALGVELESQFNQPYLSTSLQDFWGRRWNIMVSRTLRPTVYEPTLNISTKLVGRKWASLWAVFATFVVSALMHELIFYYLGRKRPTWVITWFFMLHAVSLMVEIWAKKVVADRWRLPRIVSTILTVGYVMVTGLWLFMPELLAVKGVDRASNEFVTLGTFMKEVINRAIAVYRRY